MAAVIQALCLRFVPSRTEGFPAEEVVVFRDRLELIASGRTTTIRLADIVRWPRPAWFWRSLAAIGWRPRWLPVADRDWAHPPRDRFFRFYTDPPLVIYMPDAEPAGEYSETCFVQLRQLLESGGFHTFDLG